jgi:hypothetical protein
MSLSLQKSADKFLNEWIRVLNSPDVELRFCAISEINRLGLSLPLPELERLLYEKDHRILSTLIHYTRTRSTPLSFREQLFRQILNSDNPALLRLLEPITAEIKLPVPIIKNMLKKISLGQDDLSIALLPLLGTHAEIIPENFFAALCEHKNTDIVIAAVRAISNSPETKNKPILKKLLLHHNPEVKALAALGLWKTGEPVIYKLLETEKQPEQLAFYLNMLGQTGRDPRSLNLLLRFLQHELPLLKRAAAISLAGTGNSEEHEEMLLVALSPDADAITRAIIFQSLEEVDPDFALFNTTNLYELAKAQGQKAWMEKMGRLVFLSTGTSARFDELCRNEEYSSRSPGARLIGTFIKTEKLKKHHQKLLEITGRQIELCHPPDNIRTPGKSLQGSANSILQFIGEAAITHYRKILAAGGEPELVNFARKILPDE